MAKQTNIRAVAAKLTWQIIDKGQSIDVVLADFISKHEPSPQDRGFCQELVYGVCRWYGELDQIAAGLMDKPIRNKDRVVHFVVLVGLYQLRHLEIAEHAGVAETVAACKQLQKIWAKNLVNGCLRSYLRNTQTSEAAATPQMTLDEAYRVSHPSWIRERIEQAWPAHSATILAANNQRPPMCLRVNRRVNSRADYLEQLASKEISAQSDPYSEDGIVLDKAVAVSLLPGFAEGAVSVQDTAAQLACSILDAKPGHVVLDACAAPGGKTAHILEHSDNKVQMHALDVVESRVQQLHATLDRLGLKADAFVADASLAPAQQETDWLLPSDGYDRIMIDAPCSGLGVIRRHPDIKHHRRASDITALNDIQQRLLKQLWTLLKPGGSLLYMTCSILPGENQQRIQQFLLNQADASTAEFFHPNALALEFGKQTLPGVHSMDGFYYCLLHKHHAQNS